MPNPVDAVGPLILAWQQSIAVELADEHADEMRKGDIAEGRIQQLRPHVESTAFKAADRVFQELVAAGVVDHIALVAFLDKEVADDE